MDKENNPLRPTDPDHSSGIDGKPLVQVMPCFVLSKDPNYCLKVFASFVGNPRIRSTSLMPLVSYNYFFVV